MACKLTKQGNHTSKGPKITDHLALDCPLIGLHFVVMGMGPKPGLQVEYVAEGGLAYDELFK